MFKLLTKGNVLFTMVQVLIHFLTNHTQKRYV